MTRPGTNDFRLQSSVLSVFWTTRVIFEVKMFFGLHDHLWKTENRIFERRLKTNKRDRKDILFWFTIYQPVISCEYECLSYGFELALEQKVSGRIWKK